MHPIKKTKKHHNGVDIWKGGEPTYLEAWADGKVIAVKPNDSPTSGGHSVIVQSTVMGKKVTWTYFHMVKGSIKVKVGQKIEAGTVLGIMDATGMVTGKHLHWEICVGKSYVWTGNGKGYVNPMTFTKALIAKEAALAEAAVATPEDGVVAPAPTHDDAQADALAAERQAAKAAIA
jgi:murein DD-endopeptidase MepM/ murein hydrolase activator NlpD